uniref:Uncharacterized protein n=1 Tax=viral metagenome TaxID=1070528 RepID=A0A6M3M7V4_9ZZZZ
MFRYFALLLIPAIFSMQAAAQTPPKVDEKALSALIAESMKDPESLRMKNVRLHPTEDASTWHLCGEYNAKNSSGGYAGFAYFVGSAVKQSSGPLTYVVRDYGDFARSFCTSLN